MTWIPARTQQLVGMQPSSGVTMLPIVPCKTSLEDKTLLPSRRSVNARQLSDGHQMETEMRYTKPYPPLDTKGVRPRINIWSPLAADWSGAHGFMNVHNGMHHHPTERYMTRYTRYSYNRLPR